MKIAIASDHAGFELKEQVRKYVAGLGYDVLDLGAYNAEPSDYPDFAEAVGLTLMAKNADRGILICGSGVGVCVAANKMPGIRAAICHDTYSAHQGEARRYECAGDGIAHHRSGAGAGAGIGLSQRAFSVERRALRAALQQGEGD